MKYLSDFLYNMIVFFETNILLTSKSYKLNNFLFFIKITFVGLFIIKIYTLSTHFYTLLKKNVKNYINFECLIYTDKNYMKPFVIAQNKKSRSKNLSKVFL